LHLDEKTPDWCILDEKLKVRAIVELTNIHIDSKTEQFIKNKKKSNSVVCYWRDENRDTVKRLYNAIKEKAGKYSAISNKLKISYIVAVFGEIEADIDIEEVQHCVLNKKSGLFTIYTQVNGLLFFEEKCGVYSFHYEPNLISSQEVRLPNGYFPHVKVQ
jgi:hypothetical protein